MSRRGWQRRVATGERTQIELAQIDDTDESIVPESMERLTLREELAFRLFGDLAVQAERSQVSVVWLAGHAFALADAFWAEVDRRRGCDGSGDAPGAA